MIEVRQHLMRLHQICLFLLDLHLYALAHLGNLLYH